MTTFRALLTEAGVSFPWLARQTGRPVPTIRRWADGSASAPTELVAWLKRRINDPPPKVQARTAAKTPVPASDRPAAGANRPAS